MAASPEHDSLERFPLCQSGVSLGVEHPLLFH